MKQKIPVFVINLDRRSDRLRQVGKSLDDLGVKWQRVSAIDARNCDLDLLNISSDDGPIGPMSLSTRACTASHFSAWQELEKLGAKHGVVLEDDVILSKDFLDFLVFDDWIPDGAKLIKLEKYGAQRPSTLLLGPERSEKNSRKVHRMYSRHTGGAGYLISRSGAQLALSWAKPFSVPVDHLLFNETVSSMCAVLKPDILVPSIVMQDAQTGQGSDIGFKQSAKIEGLSRRWLSLKRSYFEARLWPFQLFYLISGAAKATKVTFRK